MRAGEPILRVAVSSPLRRLLDYLPPAAAPAPPPGVRVRVPLGRARRVGVVVAHAVESDVEASRLRRVLGVLDGEPLLDADHLAFLRWAAGYYHHPPGEVVVGTLSGPLRGGRALEVTGEMRFRLTEAGRALDAGALRRAPRRAALVRRLAAAPDGVTPEELAVVGGRWRDALRALERRGLVERVVLSAPRPAPMPIVPDRSLDPAQDAAVRAVRETDGFEAFLLDGVTGSGKTEVYLALIESVVAAGRQALVLIPEIGLTPQIVARFRERLDLPGAVLHSGLSEGERADAWARARAGEASVVIGTRSAIFTPLARPGLFVVDEEHDLSYKQQDGFRYSARDLAVVRARRAGVPVVLGSATPSLETLHNAISGRYRALHLPERAAGAAPPEIAVVDLRGQSLDAGLSASLLEAIGHTVDTGEQALVFVNRRGYAPVLLCRSCGWPADCTRCDAHMVLHRGEGRLRCHHCGAERTPPATCPDCGATRLRPVGAGTQRITETIARRLPEARVERLDRDRTRRRGALEAVLDAIHARRVDVLVGTQMLAKGHHFPDVTLVGIVDVDGGLFGADFRAPERMAQLLVQVAGRAGRGMRPGRVLLQTHHPDHPLLRALIDEGYRRFGEDALRERRDAGLPPFAHTALLRAEAVRPEVVRAFADAARARTPPGAGDDVRVLGPLPAPIERRAGRHRMQIWIEAGERGALHRFLHAWLEAIDALPHSRRVRWSIDVDPQETL